jgi:putative flippase GtrA
MSNQRITSGQSERAERIIRFLFVGGLIFVVYYISLYFLHTGIGMRYPLAVAISYGLSLALHFLINRSFTFSVGRGRWSQQLWRYTLTAFVNYCAQILIIRELLGLIGFGFYLSAAIAVATTSLTGFILLNNWVFAQAERHDCDP